ncbi:hypothetical protein HMPREF2978_06935 [Corynebacterium sp. HMSC074C01]|uniref:hypothetical protein n=1 Tax=unclassified Corynebacterium TaxID=2624378 RepID=UPI0008A1EBB2|nr:MULTISPECIES: hypothetical protein [unclassified Corynebacterium]OFP65711.1 hypothetical protein HMPREF2978_06935 [Corynebacterium sp. HMSC074C01]OHO61950.1 hypothetical protein HMPREF2743_01675 [Corynebacterium sp. HMSC036D02]
MKLFSRKALVAAATAATVSLSGVTVATAETPAEGTPVAATPNTDDSANGKNKDQNTDGNKKKDEESSSVSEGSSLSDMDPKVIRDWIAVFTAIIGALGTVFAFYNKNFAK